MANDSTSYGLIFLFKWRQEDDNRPQLDSSNIPDLFFARQMITNACATQALLSILLNLDESLTLPPLLSNLKEFTNSLDPETRGIAIGNSDDIRYILLKATAVFDTYLIPLELLTIHLPDQNQLFKMNRRED